MAFSFKNYAAICCIYFIKFWLETLKLNKESDIWNFIFEHVSTSPVGIYQRSSRIQKLHQEFCSKKQLALMNFFFIVEILTTNVLPNG